MGGTDFYTYRAGVTMTDAYNAAVNDALMEHGHDGYNGPISTTSGAVAATRTPMTLSGANLFAQANVERANKWEAALAIPIAADESFTIRKTKLAVEMAPEHTPEYGGLQPTKEHHVREELTKRALAEHGARIHNVTATIGVKSKLVTEPAKGTAVTLYRVAGRRALHTTRAKAVAAAKAIMDTDPWTTTLAVEAVRKYPGGLDAALVTRVTTKATGTAVVETATPKGDPAIIGWLFFGIAAC